MVQGKYRPFTVDDFPRVSSDHEEQSDAVFRNSEICLRGPSLLRRIRAFKAESGRHPCGTQYRLNDESEINVNNVGTIDCSNGCRCYPMNLPQIIDLKIAGYRHTQPGCAKISGFFATRDRIKPLCNYVYRHEIDNYEAVTVKPKTGMARLSLTNPARGICMKSHVLFEFKLCIWTEDPPEDGPRGDLVIEVCAEFINIQKIESFIETRRLHGEKCGLDMKFAVLINTVQAFVDVEILRTPSFGLDLNLYAKTSGFKYVIRLYRGVAKADCKMSSVVAVVIRSYLDLRVEGTLKDDGFSQKMSCYMWQDNFVTCHHGTVDKMVNLDEFTIIPVNVTLKTVD